MSGGGGGFWRAATGPALGALRLYWSAFVGLQVCAVLAVVGYYTLAPVKNVAHALLSWKQAGGILFVMAANIVSGALVPELLKALLRPPGRRGPGVADWLHLIAMMAILGVGVDVFYRLQGWWFAGMGGVVAVVLKILADQFGYTLFLAVPFIVAWFAWKEHGYAVGSTLAALRWPLFARRVPPLFVPNTLFWIPALAALYALPTELQFLLFVFLNGAWCLVMVFIAREISNAEISVTPGSRTC